MTTGRRLVEIARGYLGTPWHHDARLKGVGIDCVGLLVCVGREAGLEIEDEHGYGRGDEWPRMIAAIERVAEPLPEGELGAAGDILVFRHRLMSNHCGIATGDGTFIHALNSPGVARVVEQPLDDRWLPRLAATYRPRGVTD